VRASRYDGGRKMLEENGEWGNGRMGAVFRLSHLRE